jgi:hypothetical protein
LLCSAAQIINSPFTLLNPKVYLQRRKVIRLITLGIYQQRHGYKYFLSLHDAYQRMVGSLALISRYLHLVSTLMLADIFPKSVNALSTINHGMYGRSPQAPTARPPGTNQIKNPSPGAQPGGKTPSKDGKPVPFGFGAKVTGGGNAIPQTPKNIAELQAWLTDKVPRVILINRVYDFTTSSGNVTAAAWYAHPLTLSDFIKSLPSCLILPSF